MIEIIDQEVVLTLETGQGPAGANGGFSYRFIVVDGIPLAADSIEDALSITSGLGIDLAADPDNDQFGIINTDRGTVAVTTHEARGDDVHPQYALTAFERVQVMGQDDVIANGRAGALHLVAGANITITTNAGNDEVTIAATGGGSAGSGFATIMGNTGTATADTASDDLSVTGINGISVAASDNPEALVITPSYGSPVGLTPDGVNAMGVADQFARADHVHATPAAAAVGLNGGSTNGEGTSTSFSRADHTHAIANGGQPTSNKVQAASQGVSTSLARSDHAHDVLTAAPVQIQVQAAAEGNAVELSRADHAHSVSTGTPVALGAAAAPGTATSLSRSDHVHPRPSASDIGVLSFANVAVAGQGTVVADGATDTLTLAAGAGVTITTDPATDTVTIASQGNAVAVADEGTQITASVSSLNFTGAGVTATATGNAVTVNVPGGGGGGGSSATGDISFINLGGY